MEFKATKTGARASHKGRVIEVRKTKSGPYKGRWRIYVDGTLQQDYLCVSKESAMERAEKQLAPRLAEAKRPSVNSAREGTSRGARGDRNRGNWY